MKFTAKQARFIDEYMLSLNATQAAITAGYAEKTARFIGSENLTKPNISAEIARRQKADSTRMEIAKDRVLQELARVAFCDIRDIVKWVTVRDKETGLERQIVGLIDSDDISDDAAASIAELRQTRDGIVLKMRDKLPALDKLARHLGLNVAEGDEAPKRLIISWIEDGKE